MKSVVCLFVLGFCLSSFTYVQPFKCVQCDPDSQDCEDVPVNCEDDQDLGDIFDSCYTYNMLIKEQNESYIHTIKGCSIELGCLDLRDQFCENANKTLASNSVTLKSCSIRCCNEHDYCNAVPVPATKQTNVLGYSSGSTSRTPMLLYVPVALFVTYFILN
ncbi:hypothetical protein AC249_AIPGENE13109 [Exaiptasia diaphana]|nr:hypothetical protein AC249_AIPGENE13109 [Exaiptasia diaphana]